LVLEEHPRTRFLVAGSQEPETYAELQTLVHTLGIEDQVSWL